MLSRLSTIIAVATLTASFVPSAEAQTAKHKPAPPRPNEVKKQGQVAGANGQFGETYTLTGGFNTQILAARYTLDPTKGETSFFPETDKKLLVLDVAFKNATPNDNWMGKYVEKFTAVDDKGGLFNSGDLWLESKPGVSDFATLKPGQGLGQVGLHDPLHVSFSLPAKSRIVKIILNEGRKGRSEDVIRFYVAGTTKAIAGEDGDPLNAIKSLPANAADPADPTGATLRDVGEGKIGVYSQSNKLALRVDSIAYSTENINGNPPEDGKKFLIATVTIKNTSIKPQTWFDSYDDNQIEAKDNDGETYKFFAVKKAKRDEDPSADIKPGDEYVERIVLILPKDVTAKALTLSARAGYRWQYDVSGVK